MIVIIDYNMSNIQSVKKALKRIGADAVVSNSPENILRGIV